MLVWWPQSQWREGGRPTHMPSPTRMVTIVSIARLGSGHARNKAAAPHVACKPIGVVLGRVELHVR